MLKKQLIKDWCVQSWTMEVLFGILILKAFRRNWRQYRIVPLDLTRNYTCEEGSMTGILEQFNWESLKKRTDNQLILLYKGLKGKARIPTNDLIPKTRHCRNNHSMAYQIPSASIDVCKCSVFSPRLSGTGMTSLTLCFPPLKC